jgi:hypothetical protein
VGLSLASLRSDCCAVRCIQHFSFYWRYIWRHQSHTEKLETRFFSIHISLRADRQSGYMDSHAFHVIVMHPTYCSRSISIVAITNRKCSA